MLNDMNHQELTPFRDTPWHTGYNHHCKPTHSLPKEHAGDANSALAFHYLRYVLSCFIIYIYIIIIGLISHTLDRAAFTGPLLVRFPSCAARARSAHALMV